MTESNRNDHPWKDRSAYRSHADRGLERRHGDKYAARPATREAGPRKVGCVKRDLLNERFKRL